MFRSRKRVWLVVVVFVAVFAAGIFFYMRGNDAFQQDYRDRTSKQIVSLIQNNPYDQLNVVVIVIDGLRWTEGIGAEDKYLPHIWNDLRPMGTLLTNYHIKSPTATTSVHTALLSGRVSTVPNDGHIRPIFPTFLESYRDARSDLVESSLSEIIKQQNGMFWPDKDSRATTEDLASKARTFGPEKTALYLGKDLIYSLNQSSSGRCPEDDVLLIDSRRDIEVKEYFQAKIPDVKPNMIFVNLGDVDECAHEVQWYYYVDAIRAADKIVWEMWQSLQALTKYRDKTLFIITTDHGRHIPERGGYAHHSCFCDGCRHSFMLLLGPGIKKGIVSDQPHSEVDLAPTIGAAVGFITPGSEGKPISEAFDESKKLPTPRETPVSTLVASDEARVDKRDTEKILLDSLLDKDLAKNWGNNPETAMLFLAVSARMESHPSEAADWCGRLPVIDENSLEMRNFSDLMLAYPFLALGRANENSGSTVCFGFSQRGAAMYKKAVESGLLQKWNLGESPEIEQIDETAMTAALLATMGKSEQDPDITRSAYALLLDTLGRYEADGNVMSGDLLTFIHGYKYRLPGNEIFTKKQMSMRDRMWILWGIERVLAESDPAHVPDLYPWLNRQYRLQVAFCNQWQDSNAMVGGTGDFAEGIDFAAQGLSLASIAEFKPWRRWELDQLGYSPIIFATPLFDFPVEDFFYILGQANALAGSWTANERLKLYVNDDGTIRHDLLDKGEQYTKASPEYVMSAAALAYGLGRFEKADYNEFDLELYPLVQQL
jgi:hypothetical protein